MTEGLYKLREGDTVDFGSLLTKIHEKYEEWHGVDGANNRDAEYCEILLISGGFVFNIGIDFGYMVLPETIDPENETFDVYTDLVAKWLIDNTELAGFSASGPFKIRMPRFLSRETVLVNSDYGESHLEGIVIKYPDEVPPADRLSA